MYAGEDKIDSLAQHGGPLKALAKEQVVRFLLAKDRKVVKVREECDGYYSVLFDRAELLELIAALQGLADQMVDWRMTPDTVDEMGQAIREIDTPYPAGYAGND